MMAAAGCNAIYFGIESGSPRILHEINKDIPLQHSLRTLCLCRDAGITPNAGFIVGFPSEDQTSLDDTFRAYEQALWTGTRPTHIFGYCPFIQSALYESLHNMRCAGHYLDLPITDEVDAANRRLVASDRELFGVYFRPENPKLERLLYGIDEFSPLVEGNLLPALTLARSLGGMSVLYARWVDWISTANELVAAEGCRRYYGSPLQFCSFVLEQMRTRRDIPAYIVELAEVIYINQSVSARVQLTNPTSIAGYRSVASPQYSKPFCLDDTIALGSILETLAVRYDVASLLSAAPDKTTSPEPLLSYLVWHIGVNQQVRLVQVSGTIYSLIQELKGGPQSVANLLLMWTDSKRQQPTSDKPNEPIHILDLLREAHVAGIVEHHEYISH
jgi:hypothetical protein